MKSLQGARNSPERWATRLVTTLDPSVRAAIMTNPRQAIEQQVGITVVEETRLGQRGNGGWCDGMSITRDGVIFFAPTPNSKRENFTLCHELGHFLVDGDTDAATGDWSADLTDRDRVIEEVCNIIASHLLIPDSLIEDIVDSQGMSGSALAALVARSEASREVCAIALAQRLACDGFIAVANMNDSVVTFGSRALEGYPYPGRNVPIPAGHPLLRIQAGEVGAATSWWRGPAGSSRTYYQHAKRVDHWVYAVFAANDLWHATTFHPASEQRPRTEMPERTIGCHCGYRGSARGFPCPKCHQIPCPKCGECPCDQKNRLPRGTCKRCFSSVPIGQLNNERLCTGCE